MFCESEYQHVNLKDLILFFPPFLLKKEKKKTINERKNRNTNYCDHQRTTREQQQSIRSTIAHQRITNFLKTIKKKKGTLPNLPWKNILFRHCHVHKTTIKNQHEEQNKIKTT